MIIEVWGSCRVRMGLHSGEPARHEDNYVGMDVHRAARIASAAHGGQVVLSEATRLLAASRTDRDAAPMEQYLTPARAAITTQAWTAGLAAGQALTQTEAVALLLSPAPAHDTPA